MKSIFAIVALAGLSSVAQASEKGWCHIHLQGTDKTNIDLDYQVTEGYAEGITQSFINPLWVNVSRADLSNSDRLSVKVLARGYNNADAQPQTLNLSYAGNGRFTGQFNGVTIIGNAGVQQISVGIDGGNVVDQIYGTTDFPVEFSANIEGCVSFFHQ